VIYRICHDYNGLCTSTGNIIQGDLEKEVNIVGCDTIGHCEETSSNEHAPNSERLPMWSSLDVQI